MLHGKNKDAIIIDFGFSKKLDKFNDMTGTNLGTAMTKAP